MCSKSFSHSWGDDAPALPIPAVDVLPLLTAALADPRNWGAHVAGGNAAAGFAARSDGAAVVHPLARLEVHESVVPLGLAITHFGDAPVTGASTFTHHRLPRERNRLGTRTPSRTISRPRSSST